MASTLLIAACFANPCDAQCVDLADRVPTAALQGFQVEPASLMREVRNDRSKLTGRLTAYIATDISILPAVRDFVSLSANEDRNAIGAALRRAQLICLTRKPETAQKISNFVQKLADSAVSSGYASELEAVEFSSSSVASQPAGDARPPSNDKPAAKASTLMTGEWQTDIADPFAPAPLPQ
ncbi:hypothetical protein XI06_21860 [Bradyrhizobium sp. CCBAU 11434]|nr:hypothetical protein [Bradyrhizobium sp. CCBAU 11434]